MVFFGDRTGPHPMAWFKGFVFGILFMLLIVFILSFCDNRNPINFTNNNFPNDNPVTDVDYNNEFDNWNYMQEIAEGFALCLRCFI